MTRLLIVLGALAVWWAPTAASINFNAAGSTQRVNFGTGTLLTNLARGTNGFTVVSWVYRLADGGNQHITTKDGAALTGWHFLVEKVGTIEGGLKLGLFRASAHTQYISTGGEVALNTWTFVAATFDDSLAQEVSLYTAAQGAGLTETGYSTSTAGSGTPVDDTATPLYVGNLSRVATLPFLGAIGAVGIWNRRLDLAELRLQHAHLQPTAGCVLLAILDGTGAQLDRAGYQVGYRENSPTAFFQPIWLVSPSARRPLDVPSALAGATTPKQLPLLGAG